MRRLLAVKRRAWPCAVGYRLRMVGSVESLIARAEAARQRWMKGIGYARKLTATWLS